MPNRDDDFLRRLAKRRALAQVPKGDSLRQPRRREACHRMSPTSIIDMQDVIDLTTLSRSTIYRKMAAGTFPSNRKLNINRAGWRASDVLAWLQNPR